MIVKNEEKMIGKCLDSVKDVVDEIIIVDTGSTDQTKDIVAKYTDKIYDFTWIEDFAAARNFSFSKATKQYIMWLDADDVLLQEDSEKLLQLKETLDDKVDCVQFYYNYAFDDCGKPTLVFQRERLVKRERGFQWVGFIHEVISVTGEVITSNIYVTHTRVHGDSDRNLRIYQHKLEEGITLSTRDQYYYGKELYYHHKMEEAIQELTKFIKMNGWLEDRLDALYCIADCYSSKMECKKAREYLCQCFEWGTPRAECFYRMGATFQMEKRYKEAVYWYEQIFHLEKPKNNVGFIYDELWTWKPHLELCVCYFELGDIQKSMEHNELAEKFNPTNKIILSNKEYFKGLKEEK